MNNTCYSFHNVEEQSFDKAQKICSDEFKKYGFKNGRIYEPRNLDTFVKIYKMAEEYANYPTLQLWIGLHDYDKEGEFRYGSDKQLPKLKIPWGSKYFVLYSVFYLYTYTHFPQNEYYTFCYSTIYELQQL